ncbi:MAG: hypothetical protein ACQESR_15445 [Planctomycetota bacterium]
MESCPTQAVLPLVGLAAEKVIRDRYNRRSELTLTLQTVYVGRVSRPVFSSTKSYLIWCPRISRNVRSSNNRKKTFIRCKRRAWRPVLRRLYATIRLTLLIRFLFRAISCHPRSLGSGSQLELPAVRPPPRTQNSSHPGGTSESRHRGYHE